LDPYTSLNKTERMTKLAFLTAVALVLHAAEGVIPVPFPVPGARLGLANTVTLITIVLLGPTDALVLTIIRTLLGSLLSGRLSSLIFSITGGVFATLIMSMTYKRLGHILGFSGISILGATAHNIGQLGIAGIILGTPMVLSYLPILLITGVATGFLVGLIVSYVLGYLLHGTPFTRSRPEISISRTDRSPDKLKIVYNKPKRTP
jgi:heptaprenyl diphosphate synthase